MTGTRRTRRRGGAPVAETDDEQYCEHVKDFLRARMGAAAVAYGEHLAAAAGPADEREATYRVSVDELTTAWKENPEFGNALHEATALGRTEPLKEYLASDKPLSLANRLGLIAIIERLEQRIASLDLPALLAKNDIKRGWAYPEPNKCTLVSPRPSKSLSRWLVRVR